MDDLSRIQTFINVVEAGSFSAAARDISSVSSVTRQIRSLEDELGVRLLNRSTRSLSLTEPGRRFYEQVSAVARDLLAAKSEARSFQETVKGELRVAARTSAGATMIVPALPRLLARYPELKVEISLTDERQDLIAGNIDVAIWMGQVPDSDVIARRLSPSRRIVCGAPSYFDRQGSPAVPTDLKSHNCLLYSARSYPSRWGFTKDGQTEDIDVVGNLRTDSSIVLMTAALAGLGLILVHDWMVRLPISKGLLREVLAEYRINPRPADAELFAVYASSRGMSRKVRVFVDFLVEIFEADRPRR